MLVHLRRLATTGAAYTASSVLSKLLAVFLLPLYTAYLRPEEYGAAEVMLASLVAASIIVRLGLIEALLRFYYLAGEDPRRVVASGFGAVVWLTTLVALVALPLAGPISEALLGRSEPGLARLAILGLWVLTLFEYVMSLLRLDERARAYFTVTMLNVATTIPATVVLIVWAGLGAEAILLGSFGTGALFLAQRLWAERARLSLRFDRPLVRRMLRFGLPTMPAELTLYSMSFADRVIIARYVGLAEAGLYAIAVKFGNAMQILARGFHLAWPPLAYSITDDGEARRTYALVVSWFVALNALVVAALWLLAPWLIRLMTADEYARAADAVGLVAAGVALYSLYLAMVVILGRTGRTELSFPATFAGIVSNVGLNLLLVPAHGIVGAGVALVLSYLVVVALTYVFTQRLFSVPYEWRRIILAIAGCALVIAAGESLTADAGAAALVARLGLIAAFPLLLFALGFVSAEERALARELFSPTAVRARLASLASGSRPVGEAPVGERAGHGPQLEREVYEVVQRDEDRGGA